MEKYKIPKGKIALEKKEIICIGPRNPFPL